METKDFNKTFGKSQITRTLFESLPCPICTNNITDEQMQELADYVEREVENEYPDLADKMFDLWAKEEKTEEEFDFLYTDCDRASELWWELIEDYIVEELGAVYYEDMEEPLRFATNIKWDTDGEDVDLPTRVEIPNDIDDDDIADMLSDEFGFCVFGFEIEEK